MPLLKILAGGGGQRLIPSGWPKSDTADPGGDTRHPKAGEGHRAHSTPRFPGRPPGKEGPGLAATWAGARHGEPSSARPCPPQRPRQSSCTENPPPPPLNSSWGSARCAPHRGDNGSSSSTPSPPAPLCVPSVSPLLRPPWKQKGVRKKSKGEKRTKKGRPHHLQLEQKASELRVRPARTDKMAAASAEKRLPPSPSFSRRMCAVTSDARRKGGRGGGAGEGPCPHAPPPRRCRRHGGRSEGSGVGLLPSRPVPSRPTSTGHRLYLKLHGFVSQLHGGVQASRASSEATPELPSSGASSNACSSAEITH